jgi:hypothetical protein
MSKARKPFSTLRLCEQDRAILNSVLETTAQLSTSLDTLTNVMQNFLSTSPLAVGEATADNDTPSTTHKPRTRNPTKTNVQKANSVINAIMNYNDAPNRLNTDKWAITQNTLRTWINSIATIKRVLNDRQTEINRHHAKHQITNANTHNLRHRHKRKINEVIICPFNQEGRS